MANVIDVANYILEISSEDTEDGEYELISHMKLQKLVYFAQGYYLALFGKSLFPEAIEAWPHGPVCPRLYHSLKVYGSSPIAAIIDPDKISVNGQEKSLISMVYSSYGQYSASKLRQITHKEGPWCTTPAGAQIALNEMEQYFTSLLEVDKENMHPSTQAEKDELLAILEKAEANGEINLSQFCN